MIGLPSVAICGERGKIKSNERTGAGDGRSAVARGWDANGHTAAIGVRQARDNTTVCCRSEPSYRAGNGLKQDDAKKVVKLIKDAGLKVQVAIMDDMVRVTGKKIDDLQTVIQASKTWGLGIPFQYINMKS